MQYIIDHKRAVPPQLIVPLLTDKNELVRIRAARLLLADGISPTGYFLTVFNNPSCRIAERCTALQVVVRNLQEGSREYLMGALTNPSYSIARLACRQIVKLKLYLTQNNLQHCIAVLPSVPHSMIYFSLAQRLSLWDCLIFLLTNVAVDNGRFTQEGLIRCNARVNRYYETPSESQHVQLAGWLAGWLAG
ncbi:hypothetical protein [Pantoea sp. BAV 3049]|uniref:hypothetical protein n=1 Tax=Pantoea sp. BAV 3049 TaxID=2654188 RepID=UPI00131A614F|nr:hypothetical protein [Pantoea sp. BAV 3049]